MIVWMILIAAATALAAWFAGRGALGREAAVERTRAAAELAQARQGAALAEQRLAVTRSELEQTRGELQHLRGEQATQTAAHRETEKALAAALAEASTRLEHEQEWARRLAAAEASVEQLTKELRITSAELKSAKTQIDIEASEMEKKLKLLADAEDKLGNQFKVLAGEIFREKSQRFKEESEASLGGLLNPLRERMKDFQEKVEELQKEGVVGRTELREQLGNLRMLNEQLSLEASGLARALKGSTKTQGDWGEVLLARMLESAGLRAGAEYRVQESFANQEGGQSRPDIILNLPDEKHLVIDSKVSLNSYTEYCACDDEASRGELLARHVRSLRSHVDGLNKKNYQLLHQLHSLDFVVMFVPIEPAYLAALAHDSGLWQRAWEKDVLLVSPGTLFPVIRTIAHMWQQEKQTRNVEKIVDEAGSLYDKVATVAKSFEEVGKKISGAQASFDKAYGQLSSGRGSVLTRVESLRQLGVRGAKRIPAHMLETTAASEDEMQEPDEEEVVGLFEATAEIENE